MIKRKQILIGRIGWIIVLISFQLGFRMLGWNSDCDESGGLDEIGEHCFLNEGALRMWINFGRVCELNWLF